MRVWLAERLAGLLVVRFPAERAAVRRNLTHVHPGRDAAWLDAAVDRVFARFAVCFADLLSLNREESGLWRHVAAGNGQEPTLDALAGGRGCVLSRRTWGTGNWGDGCSRPWAGRSTW